MENIDYFIDASGSDPGVKQQFLDIARGLPKLSEDHFEATVQIKEHLFRNLGFQYNHLSFKAEDVLQTRTGNCLGIPLLIGSLLDLNGIRPEYTVTVGPRDVTHRLEESFFSRLQEETTFDNPSLATEQEQFPPYRCAPLEHLVIDTSRGLVETTSEEHIFPGSESNRPVSFYEALSFVLKDRAINAMANDDMNGAKLLASQGLKYWESNRQIYSLLARLALKDFDDQTYFSTVRKYEELNTEDSLFYLQLHDFMKIEGQTIDSANCVTNALARYPSCAQAIALLGDSSPDDRVSRYNFALSSHCFANSGLLNLHEFYIVHSEKLANLFGRDKVRDYLEKANEDLFGDFWYHHTMFDLTGDENHLSEADEASNSPAERYAFLHLAQDTSYFDPLELQDLDARFSESELFCRLTKDLYRKSV